MLITLAAILTGALLTFGATPPAATWGLLLAWVAAAGVWSVDSVLRSDSLSFPAIVLILLLLALGLATNPGLAAGPVAGLWTWAAFSRSRRNVKAFLHFLLTVGLLEAGLGLAQYLVAPGWIFGYINEAYVTSGTLINRNHFAGLLGMLIPVALGLAYTCLFRRGAFARAYLYFGAAAVMGLALVFSLSRMGILSFFLTSSFIWLLIRFSPSAHRRRTPGVVLVPVLLTVAAVLWVGVDAVVARYGQLIGTEGTLSQVRFFVFRDTVDLIADHPAGIGVDAFRDVFRRYQTARNDLLFDHAHNDYLETAAEWGIGVAAAFWGMLFYLFGRAVQAFRRATDPRLRGYLVACIGAMFSIFVHSLGDFNLQIPSNSMVFFTFVGLSAALARTEGPRDGVTGRRSGAAPAAG